MKKKRMWIIIATTAAVILVGALYFTFIFHYTCEENNLSCFRAYQEKCIKAQVVNEAEGLVWKYIILGEKDDLCRISAEVLKVTSGTLDKKSLEGKSMECSLSLGSITLPDSDITKCHGILKEELQGMIINRLHAYIVDNVKEIGSELAGIVGNSTSE